ncbi:MAG: DotD/TraH family lipoprotein [Endozoicomonadaceae bacterium]|nr:DotD/TraH family lipoprotein [Endozoicomonadaceae bacterium]
MRNVLLGLFVVLVLNSIGCASKTLPTKDYTQINLEDVDQALLSSVESAQKSIQIMEQSNNYVIREKLTDKQKDTIVQEVNYLPKGMDVPFRMKQRLPLQKVLRLAVALSGYKLSVINAPKHDISVSVDAKGEPMIDALRNLGHRLGKKALIRIIPMPENSEDEYNGIVQLKYYPHTGS